MTDPRRPQDELVSAVLDGEASASERATVESDPTLAARLAAFRSMQRAIAAEIPPVDDRRRDDAVARAVAAAAPKDPASRGAPITSLDDARARRSLRARRVLLAGAAVVAVLGLAGGLSRLGDDGDTTSIQAADAPSDAAETAGGAAGATELALGSIDDPTTLAQRVAAETGLGGTVAADGTSEFSPEPSAPAIGGDLEVDEDVASSRAADDAPGPPRSAEDCTVALIEDRPELNGQLANGTVTYQGVDAHLFVYHDPPTGGVLAFVVGTDDCAVIAEVPF